MSSISPTTLAEMIWMETQQNADNKRKDEKHQKEILALKLKEAIYEAENERLKEDNRRQEDQHKKQIASYKDQLDKMVGHMEAGNRTKKEKENLDPKSLTRPDSEGRQIVHVGGSVCPCGTD